MRTILLFLSFFSLPLLAELPASAYRSLQDSAPDVVEIRVDRAKRGNWFSPGEVVTATVMKITRTGSKLKIGDVIKIKYRHVKLRGAVGPSPIPRLSKKKTYPAWLRKNKEGHFEPAARGFSFHSLGKK